MGKASRVKGAVGERQVAGLFLEHGFIAKRMVGQSRSGDNAPDVCVDGLDWLWIESKIGARPNIAAALRQAEAASEGSGEGTCAVAITRQDREKAIVSMRFDCFASLLKLAYPGVAS